MKNNNTVKISKFLSYILRHKPESIGLQLDSEGWARVDALIHCAAQHNQPLTVEQITKVVHTSDKQRFRFSDDGLRIRANQGHSVKVDLGLTAIAPPTVLYHGTATKYLTAIQQQGLTPKKRHHVHLSEAFTTAENVGRRHGELVILKVDSQRMHQDGYLFYCSENGVWLTDTVPPSYFEVIRQPAA